MTTQIELKVLTALRSSEITKDLETEHLRKIAAVAKEVEFAAGQIIYNEGEKGKAVFIIQAGKVVIEMKAPGQEGRVVVHTLGPDQIFGWSSLFPTEQKKARARAVKPTRVLAIDAVRLRDVWQTDHTLENAMIRLTSKVMLDRIKSARAQLAEVLARGDQA